MSIFNNNGPTKEFEGSRRQREIAQARFEAKQANNRAIAAAHQRPSGPEFTSSTETQPQLIRPVVNVPSG